MKKLLVVLILAGLAFGAWKYLEKVQNKTAENQDRLKTPSEKFLKEEMQNDAAK